MEILSLRERIPRSRSDLKFRAIALEARHHVPFIHIEVKGYALPE